METEKVTEMLYFCYKLAWPITQEDFITFSHHRRLKSYKNLRYLQSWFQVSLARTKVPWRQGEVMWKSVPHAYLHVFRIQSKSITWSFTKYWETRRNTIQNLDIKKGLKLETKRLVKLRTQWYRRVLCTGFLSEHQRGSW